jgi:hypothetical protein
MSRCLDCRFSRKAQQLGAIALFCRVNPPQIQITPAPGKQGGSYMAGVWPPVQEGDWCGKFELDPRVN